MNDEPGSLDAEETKNARDTKEDNQLISDLFPSHLFHTYSAKALWECKITLLRGGERVV